MVMTFLSTLVRKSPTFGTNTFPLDNSRPDSVVDQGLSGSSDGNSARCWADTGSTGKVSMISSRSCSRSSKGEVVGGAERFSVFSAAPKWSSATSASHSANSVSQSVVTVTSARSTGNWKGEGEEVGLAGMGEEK